MTSSPIPAERRTQQVTFRTTMSWQLKKDDETIYGPVDLAMLQRWAADGRVAPEDMVSEDSQAWTHAYELDDLHMYWMVEQSNETSYGPIHLLAIRHMMVDGAIGFSTPITHKRTGESMEAGPMTDSCVAITPEA